MGAPTTAQLRMGYNLKKSVFCILGLPARDRKRYLNAVVSKDLVSTGVPSHFLVTMVYFCISEL